MMTDASSEEEEEEDDYSPTVSRRRRRPTATPSSAATPKSAARRNKGKAKAGVVASAAPVVAVARPPPPTYVPPAGHWVTRINQPQVTHAHGRPYYSPLKMDENCALSIQDLVNLSPLVQAMGKKQLEPCFYAFKRSTAGLTVAQLSVIKGYLLERCGIPVPGRNSPKQVLANSLDSLIFPDTLAERARAADEKENKARLSAEEKAAAQGRIAIKAGALWGLKCKYSDACKSIESGHIPNHFGFCYDHFQEVETLRLKSAMEAHAARFDRKAILPNSCSSWTLQCTEPDCAKGVRPFAPKDDVEGSKFCPSHQELKEQKIVIDRVLANNPGRSSILITTDSWRRYNHYWTLKCEKEGCLNGVGEHISTTNCPKYCDTHRVLENRRVALEAQKAIVEAVLSALPPGRKLVLIKASPAEQVQGLNDFWTLGCGEEDCTNGVGRYINAHNHPKYCTPHLREKREALELEAGKARIDAVVARGDSTRKAKLVSVVGGGSYWTLQCTKSSCSEGVGSYVSMNDVPSLCVSHKAEADLQKLKEGLDERAIKESRVVISVISPETGCNTWTLKCIQAGCDAKEYHMKRCLKHYYSQRNEIAEEQLPIILDKTFAANPNLFASHRPVVLIKAWPIFVNNIVRNDAFNDNLSNTQLAELQRDASQMGKNLRVWMLVHTNASGGLLTDQTIRSHVTQNGIVFNNRKPNAPAQHKRYLDVTDVWPTTANQSIKINLNTYTSRIFCNQDAYCLFVLVEIMAQNNIVPRVYSQTICKAQVELKALVDEAETLVSLSLSTSTENGVGSSSSSSTSSPSKLLASAIRASITALASNSDESIAAVGSSSSSSISRESLPSYLTPFWRSNDTVDVNKMEEDLKTLFSGKRMLKDAIEAEKKSPNASASIDGGDDDDDISCGDQQINFSCPLSLTRITNPARGNKCKHFQCFDLETFVACGGASGASQTCPLCKNELNAADLIIDQNFLYLLSSYPNADKCLLHPDGTDSALTETFKTTASTAVAAIGGESVVNLLDDDDSSVVAAPLRDPESAAAAFDDDVIVISDDEEDEEEQDVAIIIDEVEELVPLSIRKRRRLI